MNAILAEGKRCADCLHWLPLSSYRFRSDRPNTRFACCLACEKVRMKEAKRRSRLRALGALLEPDTRPTFVPPADFLPMGEPVTHAPLVWMVGVPIPPVTA